MVTLVAAVLVVIVVVLFVTVVVIIVKVVVVVVTVVVAIVIFLAVLNYDSDVAVSLCSVFTLLCALFLMLNRVLGNTFSSEPRRVFYRAFNFKQSFEESENSGYSW